MFHVIISRSLSGLLAVSLHGALLLAVLPEPATQTSAAHVQLAPLIARLLFEEQNSEHTSQPAFSNVSLQASPDVLAVRPPKLPEIEAVASDSFEASRKVASVEERVEVERLQKLYVGQINARLARLLEDATRSLGGVDAKCTMHVIQDERGNVLDVTTEECEADVERRDRLVQAIRGASPLPLPPQGLASGSYLTLDLTGM